MEEESRFRVEAPEEKEEEKEKTGLFRPLPQTTQPTVTRKGKSEPIVKLLGRSMTERRRDLLVLFLMPLLAGIVDATIYSQIMVFRLEATGIVTFAIPMLVAIPIGLVVGKTSHSLIGALLAVFFFVVFFVLFLITPALIWPALDIGQFLTSSLFIAAVYLLLVVLASLMGALIGAIFREFF